MSLKLFIDEDIQDRILIKLLRNANHNVITVNEAGLMGQADSYIFNYARQNSRTILTYNCNDFETIHLNEPEHSGILAVYRDYKFSKNMSFQNIVKAIANLEATSILLENQFITLNQWNY